MKIKQFYKLNISILTFMADNQVAVNFSSTEFFNATILPFMADTRVLNFKTLQSYNFDVYDGYSSGG